MKIEKRLSTALQRCQIYLEGERIDNEPLLQLEQKYLSQTTTEDEHNTAFFLHSGSICYDAVAFALCIITNMVLDTNTGEKEILNYEVGDKVIYKNRRWEYIGTEVIDKEIRYKLYDGKNETRYISKSLLGQLIPYNGNAEKLGAQGAKSHISKRLEFLKVATGKDIENFSASSSCTTVLFMENTKLDYLIENLAIKCGNKLYKILELVTISFFTQTRELRKAGNPGKNEADIKVTNNMEKARELVSNREGKEVLGFCAFNKKSYEKSASDFERVLYRKKLRYSWLVSRIEYSPWIEGQIDSDESIMFLALTAETLKGYEYVHSDFYLIRHLRKEADNIVHSSLKVELSDNEILWKDYRHVKNDIKFIMDHAYNNEQALQFSRWAYSMLKLFNYSVFSFEDYEKFLAIENPIKYYAGIASSFSTLYSTHAENVISYLKRIYKKLYYGNPKNIQIRTYLLTGRYRKAVIVAPNNKNAELMKKTLDKIFKLSSVDVRIIPEAKLEETKVSDSEVLVFPALLNFEKYNPFNLYDVKERVIFLYDAQYKLFKKIEREYNTYIQKINERVFDTGFIERLTPETPIAETGRPNDPEIKDVEEYIEQDNSLKDYFMKAFLESERTTGNQSFRLSGGNNAGFTDVYMYGLFSDGEHILFTKGYKPYVFDEETGTVLDKNIEDIIPGQQLLFTRNDSKTKDIVDDILVLMLSKSEILKLEYGMVCEWKDRLTKLKEHGNTYNDLSKRFKKYGMSISAAGIRGWIDPLSHVVGPMKVSSYKIIGQVLNYETMIEGAELFERASADIRRTRVHILKLIEKVVVADLNGFEFKDDSISEEIIQRIRETAIIKQLDRIETVDTFKVQINRVNRPLEG